MKVLLLLTLLSSAAFSDSKSLQSMKLGIDMNAESPESQPGEFTATEIQLDGVPYVEIRKGKTSIILPRLMSYDADQFEKAFCHSADQKRLKEKPVIGARVDVTSSFQVYADVVQKVMLSDCKWNSKATEANLDLRPEVGVTYKPKNGKNENLKYKGFLRGMNEVGVGIDY